MKKPLAQIFVDSDVVISSLISSSGAAGFLINQKEIEIFVSNLSIKKIKEVIARMQLSLSAFNSCLKNNLKTIRLSGNLAKAKEEYGNYVFDEGDAHIIAGAVAAKADFLISYSLKHYKMDKIKTDFDILVLTPARFLQYSRSL